MFWNRAAQKWPLLIMFWLFAVSPVAAQEMVTTEMLIKYLHNSGYSQVTTERTMLGRTRIIARGGTMVREIIFNARKSEVLRDIVVSNVEDATMIDDLIWWNADIAHTDNQLLADLRNEAPIWEHRTRREILDRRQLQLQLGK